MVPGKASVENQYLEGLLKIIASDGFSVLQDICGIMHSNYHISYSIGG